MRIEAGDTMNLVEGNLAALGKVFQLCLGQIAVTQLDGAQFVKNHGGWSREPLPLLANDLGTNQV